MLLGRFDSMARDTWLPFQSSGIARVPVTESEAPLRTCSAVARRRRPRGRAGAKREKQRQPERQAVAGSSFPLLSTCRVPISWSCAQLRTCSAADRPGRRRLEPISTVWPASEDPPPSPAPVAHWQSMILSTQAAGPGLGPAACWGSPASLQLRKVQRGG